MTEQQVDAKRPEPQDVPLPHPLPTSAAALLLLMVARMTTAGTLV
jgi:hypothetical protein